MAIGVEYETGIATCPLANLQEWVHVKKFSGKRNVS